MCNYENLQIKFYERDMYMPIVLKADRKLEYVKFYLNKNGFKMIRTKYPEKSGFVTKQKITNGRVFIPKSIIKLYGLDKKSSLDVSKGADGSISVKVKRDMTLKPFELVEPEDANFTIDAAKKKEFRIASASTFSLPESFGTLCRLDIYAGGMMRIRTFDAKRDAGVPTIEAVREEYGKRLQHLPEGKNLSVLYKPAARKGSSTFYIPDYVRRSWNIEKPPYNANMYALDDGSIAIFPKEECKVCGKTVNYTTESLEKITVDKEIGNDIPLMQHLIDKMGELASVIEGLTARNKLIEKELEASKQREAEMTERIAMLTKAKSRDLEKQRKAFRAIQEMFMDDGDAQSYNPPQVLDIIEDLPF